MKKILLEMPWGTNIHCTKCHFKFGADFEIERLTDDPAINKKYMDLFWKIRLISLPCPKCQHLLIHDFTKFQTYNFEDIMKVLNDERPDGMSLSDYRRIKKLISNSHLSMKNLKLYLTVLKNLLQTRLEIGRSVIPESVLIDIEVLLKNLETQPLSFAEFTNIVN